jgi:copper homeostasis protein
MTLLEICVDTAAGLRTASASGADRIELCSALELGGLTPTSGLLALAAEMGVSARVMIRPRAGDFVFTTDDLDMMRADIAAARAHGLEGVVLGANRPDGALDLDMLGTLVEASQGLRKTLHRAFDLVPDIAEAVEQAVALGFDTILTSGRGSPTRSPPDASPSWQAPASAPTMSERSSPLPRSGPSMAPAPAR